AIARIFNGENLRRLKDMLIDHEHAMLGPAKTPEARIFRQIDKLDMMLQAIVYEQRLGIDLHAFYGKYDEYIQDPRLMDFFLAASEILRTTI
nr:hypothetical protein [Candidatus Sigynarchaeota archaeon]